MENKQLTEPQVMLPAREISVVTGEIIELRRQVNNMALMYAIEIGRRLCEAKSILPHGQWGEWLKNEVDFSQSTANNLMKLYDEYGQSQLSLFGAVPNSQTIGNLPYSKALLLLAVPENERESFAQEVKAEEISVKELKTAIDERNAAIKRAEEAEKKTEEIAQKQKEAEEAAAEAEKSAKEAETLRNKVAELEKQLSDEKNNLKNATENPELSDETLKKIKDDAAKQAKEEAAKDIEKKLSKAKADAEKAEQKRRDAEKKAAELEERLLAAQKQIKIANPEIAAFKTLFDEMQKTAQLLKDKLNKIKVDSPEVAEKLSAALKAFGSSF